MPGESKGKGFIGGKLGKDKGKREQDKVGEPQTAVPF